MKDIVLRAACKCIKEGGEGWSGKCLVPSEDDGRPNWCLEMRRWKLRSEWSGIKEVDTESTTSIEIML